MLSPAHAEIYACSEGVKEARQLQWILADMGVELTWPIVIKVDNTQVISFCNQTCLDSKLKGMIDNRLNWVRELKDEGTVVVQYVNTRLNQADILSKCLAGTQFREQVVMISGGCLKSQVKREDIFVNLCHVVKKSRAGAEGASSVKLQSQESGGVSSMHTEIGVSLFDTYLVTCIRVPDIVFIKSINPLAIEFSTSF